MSKNFEEEYRQMIASELPDLWNRIEAQLPKAAAAVTESVAERLTEEAEVKERITYMPASEAVNKENVIPAGRRKIFRNAWMPAVIAGAAVLCMLAALPVLFLPRSNQNESKMIHGEAEDGASGGDMQMQTYFDESDCEEAADQQSDGGCLSDETNCAVAAPAEPSAAEDAVQAENVWEASGNDMSFAYTEEAEPDSEGKTDSEGKLELYQLEVQILDCILEEDGELFYEALVLRNVETGSKEGGRVYFRCARDGEAQNNCANVSFQQGERYLLSLYASDETLENYGVEIGNWELYAGEMYIVWGLL